MKPKVQIALEPILEAYCRFIFNTPEEEKEIAITRHSDIGKLISALVVASELPVKRTGDNLVTFLLPVNEKNQHGVKYHFLTVHGWAEQRIQDLLEYEYRKWVQRRFEIGYAKKYTQKEIIEAILRALNVRDNVANFDAIKKMDYRNRRKVAERRFIELLESDQW